MAKKQLPRCVMCLNRTDHTQPKCTQCGYIVCKRCDVNEPIESVKSKDQS